jgi:hypothetical protein
MATPFIDKIRARLSGNTMAAPSKDDGRLSKPDSRSGKLQRISLQWLRHKEAKGEIPTSLRFLFYELEQQGYVSKDSRNLDGTPSARKADM